MKNNKALIFIFLLLSGSILFSCKNKRITPFEREQIRHDSLVTAQKNQDISLSFNGIVLGASLTSTIDSINNNSALSLSYHSNEKCKITAKLIDYNEDIIYVNADITAFNDKIFYIIIKTDKKDLSNKLNCLYNTYYSNKGYETTSEKFPWDNEKADYTECQTKETKSWDFRNQRLEIIINGIDTRERYIKDATKEYYENRYGTRYNSFFENMEINYIEKNIENEYKRSIEKAEEEMKLSQRLIDSLNMEKKKIEETEKAERVQNAMKQQSL